MQASKERLYPLRARVFLGSAQRWSYRWRSRFSGEWSVGPVACSMRGELLWNRGPESFIHQWGHSSACGPIGSRSGRPYRHASYLGERYNRAAFLLRSHASKFYVTGRKDHLRCGDIHTNETIWREDWGSESGSLSIWLVAFCSSPIKRATPRSSSQGTRSSRATKTV